MKPNQKTYDSYDYTVQMLKVSEDLHHHHNLSLIRQRKSPFMGSLPMQICKRQEDQVNKYFRNKNDEYISNRILDIRKKPAVSNSN